MSHTASSPSRPPSDVSSAVGWVGLAALLGWVMVCRCWPWLVARLGLPGPGLPMSGPYAALVGLLVGAGAMAAWSLLVDRVHRRPSTGLDWSLRRPWRQAWGTAWVKLLGLWVSWSLVGFLYCLGRWYWSGSYDFSMRVLAVAAPPLVVLSLPYVWWLERYLTEPLDGAYAMGAWLLGRACDPPLLAAHARSWAVKGFFIAFMLGALPQGFAGVVSRDWGAVLHDPVQLANALIDALFMIDVQIGTVGYLLTLRPLDAHIRSANPLLAGWVAALICYPPFVLMGGGGVLDYHPGTADWTYWLAGHGWALWLWGALLVGLTAVYASATVAFGLRFSNLTWRGVITHGPYRLTRHPAYVSKNLFWWAATLPFLVTTHTLSDAVRDTVTLALVSGVYYWRAKTEEAHLLSEDPKYQAYWRWAESGAPITRWLNRLG